MSKHLVYRCDECRRRIFPDARYHYSLVCATGPNAGVEMHLDLCGFCAGGVRLALPKFHERAKPFDRAKAAA